MLPDIPSCQSTVLNQEELDNLRTEVSYWMQELFESNRYAESLCIIRQQSVELIDDLQRRLIEINSKLEGALAEVSIAARERVIMDEHLLEARTLLIERTARYELLIKNSVTLEE